MKVTQQYLDYLATAFGFIAGVSQLLMRTKFINENNGLLISGLATICLGIVANKGRFPYRNNINPPNYYPSDFLPYDSPPYNDPYYEPPTSQALLEAKVAPTETPYKSPYESSTQTSNTACHSKYNRSKRNKSQRQSDRPSNPARDAARFKRNTGKRLKIKCEIPKTDD